MALYAFNRRDDGNLAHAEKELMFSIEKTYDLYHFLLLLVIELADIATEKIDQALQKRITKTRPDSQIVKGDANKEVHNITKEIRRGTLSLAFLDPYSLQIDFETLRVLAAKQADLIIFFPDRLDILRNWKHYYYSDLDSKLDRHLGLGSGWRPVLENAPPGQSCGDPQKILCGAN